MKQYWIIDEPCVIGEFLLRHGISQKAIKAIKMKGEILVDGKHQTVRYLLQVGETLTIIYPPEDNHMVPVEIPLKIVYEDDYLLVVDKPKGLPSIPTRQHPYYTLANALTFYYQQIHLNSTIHLVNRLDKDTSGLMIVAKYRYIHDKIMKDLQHIDRRYRAHVKGIVKGEELPEFGVPESFRVVIKEFQALGLDITVLNNEGKFVELKDLEEAEKDSFVPDLDENEKSENLKTAEPEEDLDQAQTDESDLEHELDDFDDFGLKEPTAEELENLEGEDK